MSFIILFCLFSFCAGTSLAASLNENQSDFNIKEANHQFDQINLQLSVQNLKLSNLNTAIVTLTQLTTQADQCTDEAQKKLKNIEMQMQQTTDSTASNKESADLIYLGAEQKKASSKKAQCRLFSIRAKEAIEAYNTASAQLKQEETLTRGQPLWRIINQFIASRPDKALSFPLLVSRFLPLKSTLPLMILIVGVAILLSTIMLIKLRKNSFIRKYFRIRKLQVTHILLLSACIISGSAFIYFFDGYIGIETDNFLPCLSTTLFFYFSACAFIVLLFKVKKIKAFFYWYSLESGFFESLLIFFLSFYTLNSLGILLAVSLNIDHLLTQLTQTIFLLAMLTTAISFIYYFCRAHQHLKFIKHHHHVIKQLCSLLLAACALLDIVGYHTLGLNLTFSGLTTFAIIFITILVIQGINKAYLLLNQHEPFHTKITSGFGYKKEDVFTEFLILKTTALVIVIAISVYLIGRTWGFATYYIERLFTQFLYGIHLGSFTFYPTRIVAGVVSYCLVYLLFRSISTSISKHQQFEEEEETQVAVASILTYIGFGAAVITGLLVAGFNFTGLAIVAGALSVGIGLGLQSIVNNFVSGLILLIEKPIKPGDRINVNGIEGFVKKIRVRSTHIITPAREDIIVPNSDLITRQVTNYMYSDKHLSIACDIGVAYGSDTKLVQEVLLSIANNHDEVIKTSRSKPTVLLSSFGDSNMMFQLWCLIKDANKKSLVKSELNFAIEQAFRENNISMALPQLDVHMNMTEIK